jgi:hypothetical protein
MDRMVFVFDTAGNYECLTGYGRGFRRNKFERLSNRPFCCARPNCCSAVVELDARCDHAQVDGPAVLGAFGV